MTPVDPLIVAAAVAEILDRLAIPYVIGGSVASSVFGEPRSTPEDLIIRKLLWFRAGGESSSRQWRDVVSVMKTAPIDRTALLQRGREQNIEDLVLRAAADAGLELRK